MERGCSSKSLIMSGGRLVVPHRQRCDQEQVDESSSSLMSTWVRHHHDDQERSRSLYVCSFCRRDFSSAQALGGHMNVHRRDRATLLLSSSNNLQLPPPPSSSLTTLPNHHHKPPPSHLLKVAATVSPSPQLPSSGRPSAYKTKDGDQENYEYPVLVIPYFTQPTISISCNSTKPVEVKKEEDELVSLELGIGCLKQDANPLPVVLDLELRLRCST